MQQIFFYFVFVAYFAAQYVAGRFITKLFFGESASFFSHIASFLIGVTVAIPASYVLSVLFSATGQPILWGVLIFEAIIFICFGIHVLRKDTRKIVFHARIDRSLLIFVVFSFVFSWWIMTKTFHGGVSGELFVGSNNVFDFGHALGIERSFSWGDNIPFTSPFRAGLPFFYHFFFLYWVAIWEYFGTPLVWAMNIPSILSFFGLLVMVYYLPQRLLKQGRFVGWITVALTITHSTLTFWHLLASKGLNGDFFRSIWQLPTYPYAGPFDGSVISIFTTLNNYVNQRHLAFAIAVGLILIMGMVHLTEEKNMSYIKLTVLGGLTGLLFFWNIAICASVVVVCISYLVLSKRWNYMMMYGLAAGVVVLLSMFPYFSKWKDVTWLLTMLSQPKNVLAGPLGQTRSGLLYLWENLSILPAIVALGFIITPQKKRIYIMPLFCIFVLECIYAAASGRGFDQKFFSFFIIGANMLAAVGIVWLWKYKHMGLRVVAFILFFVITVSGLVDLMAIKNEFAYPLIDAKTAPVVKWIHDNTPRGSVFVSYSDIIDPVALSGRKNYFGFFGNLSLSDRTSTISRVYSGDTTAAKSNGISYVLMPKWPKSDFYYQPNVTNLRSNMTTVFESEEYLILGVR